MKWDELLNKDDKALFSVCQFSMSKGECQALKKKAIDNATQAVKGQPDIKKENAARRAINQTLIEELKKRGINNWRELVRK